MKLPKKITWNDVSDSRNVRRVLLVLGVLIVLIGVFKAGEIAGYHRAQFATQFGDSFDRNFRGESGGMMFGTSGLPHEMLPPGGHGAAGTIASVSLPTIVVADRDGLEKTIHITDKTDIREYRDQLAASALTVGEHIIVLGQPNTAGQIEAVVIRVLPEPSATSTMPVGNPGITQ